MYKSSKIRFLSLFLCLAVVFSSLPFTAMTASAEVEPSKPTAGDGTSGDPYQIGTEAELLWFAKTVNGEAGYTIQSNACAELTSDITLTGTENNWTPIGYFNSNKDNKPYTGTFDGKGHEVQNIQFNDSAKEYVGLFGYVGSGGKVQNVGVTGGSFTGQRNVGGVCGFNKGTISNCYNSGSVHATLSYVGGVCGFNKGGTISNCYNSGSVSGGACVGGVCGENSKGIFINCYNSGNVSGNENVGGVCGEDINGTYTNCYWENSSGKGDKGIGNDTTATTTPFKKEANAEPTVESGKKLVDLLNANRTDAGKTAEWSQWYTDKNADKYPTFNALEIATYSDLKAFLEDTGDFKGMTSAKLTKTVTATDADVTTNTPYEGLEITASAHVTATDTPKTIDLNGFDIDFASNSSIYVPENATLTVTNSNYPTTQSNIKNGAGVDITFGTTTTSGGAFYNCGTLNVYGVNIKDCTAKNGGGIFNEQYSTSTISDVSIENCTATTAGGIYNNYDAIATLTDVKVTLCTATSRAGVYNEGNMTLAGSTQITGNTAGSIASNLTVAGDSSSLYYASVTLAQGFTGSTGVAVCDSSSGNPIAGTFATGTNISGLAGKFTSDIEKYHVYAPDNNSLALAPEIATYGDLKAFLEDTGDFKGMTSAKLTKTVTATDGDVEPKKSGLDSYTTSAYVTADTPKTIDLNGYDIDFNNENSIYIPSKATLTVTNSSLTTQSNIRNGIGVEHIDPNKGISGGAFFNSGTLSISNVQITDCTAKSGGGIRNGNNVKNDNIVMLNTVAVTNCTATDCGGIYNFGTATLTDVTVTDCTATNYAGVYNERGNMTLAGDTQIAGNKDGNATPSNLVVFNASYKTTPVTLAQNFNGTVGVTAQDGSNNPTSGIFATGTNISGLMGNFTSDIDKYEVCAPDENHLALRCAHLDWKYTTTKTNVDGDTIYATCTNCPTATSLTVTSTNAPYDGKEHAASFTNLASWTNVGLATPTIMYATDSSLTSKTEATPTNAGTYYASITVGTDTNIATATTIYTIAQRDVTNTNIATIPDYTYTGSPIEPVVTVTDLGGKLASGTDYDVSYASNTNVGTAGVTITGNGNYTGTKNTTFEIKQSPLTLQVSASDITYGQTLEDSKLTVTATDASDRIVTGTSVWTTPTTMPKVSDSDKTEHDVTFTPTDGINYNITTTKAKLIVNKATATATTLPTTITNLVYDGSEKALITTGSNVTGGLFYYKLRENGEWRTSVPTATNAGLYDVYYKVSATDVNYKDSEQTKLTARIAEKQLTGKVTITGLTAVGQTLTATHTDGAVGETFSYQWFRDNGAITGATGNTYALTTDDIGKTITVKITGTGNYAGEITSSATEAVSKSIADTIAIKDISVPITGEALVATATCSAEGVTVQTVTWSPSNTTAAAGTAYIVTVTLNAKDNYKFVSPTTATVNEQTATATNVSDKQIEVSYTFRATAATPTINTQPASTTVTATEMATFSVTATTTDLGTLSYQWQKQVSGTTIWNDVSGATNASYTISPVSYTMNGDKYHCIITNTKDTGNISKTTSSEATLTVTPIQIIGTVTLTGTLEVEQTLTASYISGAEGETYSYQWYRDSGKITGATSETYTLKTEDIGQIITVKVTGNGEYGGTKEAATEGKILGIPALKTAPTATKAIFQANCTPAEELVTAGTAENGTLQYKLLKPDGSATEWSGTIPTTETLTVGKYTLCYRVKGDDNYKTIEDDDWCVEITVDTGSVEVIKEAEITGTTEVEAQGVKCENLEEIAPMEKVPGENVKIELVVTATTLTNFSPDKQKAFSDTITEVFNEIDRDNLKEEYLDVHIDKYINDIKSDTVSDTVSVMEIIVSYTDLNGKTPVIIRYHDNKAMAFNKLSERPTDDFRDGTFYVEGNRIYIYSRYYSDYSMVYTTDVCYTVSFNADGGSEASPFIVASGTTITLPTSTKSGYTLSGWSDGATTYSAGSSYKAGSEDVNFTAVWKQNGGDDDPEPSVYTIIATATDGGTITPSGTVKVIESKSQSFNATANDGYTLEKFVVDGKNEYINGDTYTFENVSKNHTIQAVFTKKEEPTPPTPTPTPTDTGWKQTTDGKWQYLNENGKAVTGWQNNIKGWEGQWFYFDKDGNMQVGWYLVDGKWYYFDRQTGVMQKGWAFVDDGHGDFTNKLWYYLDPTTGAMQTDWQKIDGKWYYLDYNRNNWGGAMQTGWQWIPYSAGEAWFCFANNGAMYENCITPDGYTVDDNGVWVR